MSYMDSVPGDKHYTYDYFFLDYVCRLCWGTAGVVELNSCSPSAEENNITVAEKIQECIGIDTAIHKHPKKVCSKCIKEIEYYTEFKRFCQENDKKLQAILQNGPPQETEPKRSKIRKVEECIAVKEECEEDSHLDNLFESLPLSCEISSATDKPIRKRKRKPPYYCNSCYLNLECHEKLSEHNLEIHGIEENGLYKCFGCVKRFQCVKKRLRHESEICKQLKIGYKCNICDRFLAKRKAYEQHIRAHKENHVMKLVDENKCNKCNEYFENIESLQEHMTMCEKIKKTYVCDTCGRVFSRRDYLHKHKLMHEGSKQQKCPYCDFSAVQRSTLTVHLRKHTGERPYACDLCPHRCVTSSNLKEHKKRHFGIKSFQCKLCDKKFGYKISLEEHMSSVHERSESHACSQCGATYSRFRALRRHLLTKHGSKIKKNKDTIQLQIDKQLIHIQNAQHDEKGQSSEVNFQLGDPSVTDCQNSKNNDDAVMKSESKVINMTFELKDPVNIGVVENVDGVVYLS